jgi:hypothetical protein
MSATAIAKIAPFGVNFGTSRRHEILLQRLCEGGSTATKREEDLPPCFRGNGLNRRSLPAPLAASYKQSSNQGSQLAAKPDLEPDLFVCRVNALFADLGSSLTAFFRAIKHGDTHRQSDSGYNRARRARPLSGSNCLSRKKSVQVSGLVLSHKFIPFGPSNLEPAVLKQRKWISSGLPKGFWVASLTHQVGGAMSRLPEAR